MPISFLISNDSVSQLDEAILSAIGDSFAPLIGLAHAQAELSFVSLEEIRELNTTYRNIDEPTDVLSFPVLEGTPVRLENVTEETLLGSIVISPEKAEIYGETIPQLTVHGLLHLLGYDHETDMDAWLYAEGKVLAELQRKGYVINGIPYDTL